eukprot:TRINITY_DN22180_c0_g1_i1.p1 TRINITY_DN22180_c0_g1~~TRINITY_DN22180_c0_g1_i1.p1  ORF type:complete len:140 (-),score=29.53 TRINITY_DN22180_c0_g1_i1:121-495(-)
MADRRGNVLHSKQEDEAQEFSNRFVLRLLDMVRQELRETGDRDWMVDCVDQASVRLSHIEGVSRRVASGLVKLGFGPGQTLHTVLTTAVVRTSTSALFVGSPWSSMSVGVVGVAVLLFVSGGST